MFAFLKGIPDEHTGNCDRPTSGRCEPEAMASPFPARYRCARHPTSTLTHSPRGQSGDHGQGCREGVPGARLVPRRERLPDRSRSQHGYTEPHQGERMLSTKASDARFHSASTHSREGIVHRSTATSTAERCFKFERCLTGSARKGEYSGGLCGGAVNGSFLGLFFFPQKYVQISGEQYNLVEIIC